MSEPIPCPARRMSRRAMLKAAATAGFCAPLALRTVAQSLEGSGWHSRIISYLETLARADGGYAWPDQDESHLTPTFAAIGCYRALGRTPPQPARLADFVRTHHPSHLKKLEQERRGFTYQQIQSLVWLEQDASMFADQVRSWRAPLPYLKQYERNGYPVFQSELGAFTCRALLGLPLTDLEPAFVSYLNSRRRANGSFNNTPAGDGGDGHAMNTWWGLQVLHILGRAAELQEKTISWLRQCQLPSGGFTWAPQAEFGGVADVIYTWAAVRALRLLGSAPTTPGTCAAWLRSLANAAGGFGGRPGWASNPLATYYALDALRALDALEPLDAPTRAAMPRSPSLPEDLKVFTIQIEAHGQGSPADAVELARGLRIHLWGAKNSPAGWLESAQAIADRQKVPVRFFTANEEYGTWVHVPGLGTYSHTSDIIAPPGTDFGPSLAGKGEASWPEFRERRLRPLLKVRGRLVWQFGENEELVRLFLDDSLAHGGYAAISTFHFGNPDFTNTEPFLQCYRGHIPFVALQDAHGPEPWWFADMTTGFRTLFLASEPTWEGWLNALERNWVVAVRRDALSRAKTWMHSGSDEVLKFVRRRELEWRWWDNPAIQRPWVSMVAVRPDDPFEAGRPEAGILIRVRCAWENTAQGLPKRPLAELVRLQLDGSEVQATEEKRSRGAGQTTDHYYAHHLRNPAPGSHIAEVEVRVLETNQRSLRRISFQG